MEEDYFRGRGIDLELCPAGFSGVNNNHTVYSRLLILSKFIHVLGAVGLLPLAGSHPPQPAFLKTC